jgi:hypothetical protein
MTFSTMYSVSLCYAECCYAECRYAKCRGATERYFTRVGSALTHKHYNSLERPVRAKRFSLLRKFLFYDRKKFYNIGTRSNGSESLSGGREPRDDGVAASSKTPESPATDSVLTADEDTCANVLNYNKLVCFQFKN